MFAAQKSNNNKTGFSMKNVVKAIPCLVFSLLSIPALAQYDDEPRWWNGFYVGGSYGLTKVTDGAALNIDNETAPLIGAATNIDLPFRSGVLTGPVNYSSTTQKPASFEFMAGYQITEAVGGIWGVELRAAMSATQSLFFDLADVSYNSVGLYGTFQTTGDVYIKALLGAGSSTFDVGGPVGFSESTAGLGYGFAIGQKIFAGAIEIMYTRYPDVDLSAAQRLQNFEYDLLPGEEGGGFQDAQLRLDNKATLEALSLGYIYTF